MEEIRRKIDKRVYYFIKDKNNVLTRYKLLVTGIKSAIFGAQRANEMLKKRSEAAEETVIVTEKVEAEILITPEGLRVPA